MLVKVYAIEDRAEIEAYIPSTVQTCRFYEKTWLLMNLGLKGEMEALWSKVVLHHIKYFMPKDIQYMFLL